MDPIAVLYENDAWMSPLFAALENEGAPVARVFANQLTYDPADALSSFVTDAPALVGFDPHARFARWLVERAGAAAGTLVAS